MWRWYFLENISWQISLSWGFYLRWIAVMCLWRLLFSENIFWQIHTHKASFRWTVVMCFCKWPLSGILFWQNWYSHVNSSATTVRCTVERKRERERAAQKADFGMQNWRGSCKQILHFRSGLYSYDIVVTCDGKNSWTFALIRTNYQGQKWLIFITKQL